MDFEKRAKGKVKDIVDSCTTAVTVGAQMARALDRNDADDAESMLDSFREFRSRLTLLTTDFGKWLADGIGSTRKQLEMKFAEEPATADAPISEDPEPEPEVDEGAAETADAVDGDQE